MNTQIKNTLVFAVSKIHFVIIPMILCTAIAVVVALLSTSHWSASQAVYVRDGSIGSNVTSGRFDSVDMMQVSQETLLEIATHPEVLRATLKRVGAEEINAPSMFSFRTYLPFQGLKPEWPSLEDIENLAGAIKVTSPNGTQFGRTEVIYISVKAKSNERASKLAKTVSEELGKRMMRLRESRYSSIVTEMEESVKLARHELSVASGRIQEMEQRMGGDLAELRTMLNGNQGEGTVRRIVVGLEERYQRAKSDEAKLRLQIEKFQLAANNPALMLSIPDDFLNNQPGLRKLKEGLSDARLRTAQIMGKKSERHPDVLAGRESEERVATHLHKSLVSSIGGLKVELASAKQRVSNMKRQLAMANGRLGGIAGLRTEYEGLNAELQQRIEYLRKANTDLAVARGNQNSANSVSLMHLIDQPIIGTKPVSLGRSATVGIGAALGMLIGGSLIFLMLPTNATEPAPQIGMGYNGGTVFIPVQQQRPIAIEVAPSDYSYGRRATDQVPTQSS